MLPFFPQVTPTPTDHSKQITEAAAANLQFAFRVTAALFEAEAGVKVNGVRLDRPADPAAFGPGVWRVVPVSADQPPCTGRALKV